MSSRLTLLLLAGTLLVACSDSDGSGPGAPGVDAGVDLGTVPGACASDEDCVPAEGVNLCDGGYVCDQGACVPDGSGPMICEDADPDDCVETSCDAQTGSCTTTPVVNGTPCTHLDACIEGAKCAAGECAGGEVVDCEDGNDCTIDLCVPGSGCEHQVNSGQPCDDNDPCTSGDACDGANCVGGQNNCGNCGDLFCSMDEDCETCPVDCGECEGTCGDLQCDPGEEVSCPQDCAGTGACGDGVCDLGEQVTCPQDCEGQGTCGDGVCDLGEQVTCPEDCAAMGTCGDGVCDLGEQLTCPEDCAGTGGEESCGPGLFCDGQCLPLLDGLACPDDCCGNGECEEFEDEDCCYADCGPEVICGDAVCDDKGGETEETCPEDCLEETPVDEDPDVQEDTSDVVDEEVIEVEDAQDDVGPVEDVEAPDDATPDEDATGDATPDEDATSDATPDEDATSDATPDEDATSDATSDADDAAPPAADATEDSGAPADTATDTATDTPASD